MWSLQDAPLMWWRIGTVEAMTSAGEQELGAEACRAGRSSKILVSRRTNADGNGMYEHAMSFRRLDGGLLRRWAGGKCDTIPKRALSYSTASTVSRVHHVQPQPRCPPPLSGCEQKLQMIEAGHSVRLSRNTRVHICAGLLYCAVPCLTCEYRVCTHVTSRLIEKAMASISATRALHDDHLKLWGTRCA